MMLNNAVLNKGIVRGAMWVIRASSLKKTNVLKIHTTITSTLGCIGVMISMGTRRSFTIGLQDFDLGGCRVFSSISSTLSDSALQAAGFRFYWS